MKLDWTTQVEASEGCDCNQEINFRFRQSSIVGCCRIEAHRARLLRDWRHFKCGNTGFGCHIQATSTFEARLRGESIWTAMTAAGAR
jgi:hypothetical protein